MTKASSSGKTSANCLDCLGEAVDLLRVRAVSRLLLWALACTPQPRLHSLSAATQSAIARAGILCLRLFEALPPDMLSAAVCKLPPVLIPALASFVGEQRVSPEAQERLKQEAHHERSITGLIALYLAEDETISKLVGQHNLSWYPDGRDLSGSSIANSGAAQRRCCCCGSSSCVAPDTCSSQECFEACATVFTNLRAHIAQDADPASNKHGQTKGASLTMSAAAGCEIQATRTSVLWILFRTCLRLSSWLVTSHNTWLGMRDPVWLPPGTSLPFSLQPASKRQSLRETQLKALRRPTVEQAHQLPAAAQLPVPGARIFTLAGKKKREHCAGRLLTGAPAGVWCSCTVHGMFTAWLC
ncbi:MAG: hypothetical protein WDW36_004681 [Sanguina aurantia]